MGGDDPRRLMNMLQPSLRLREQLGLADSALSNAVEEAGRHARLRGLLADEDHVASLREMTVAADIWRGQERLRIRIEGPDSSLARAAQGYAHNSTMARGHGLSR